MKLKRALGLEVFVPKELDELRAKYFSQDARFFATEEGFRDLPADYYAEADPEAFLRLGGKILVASAEAANACVRELSEANLKSYEDSIREINDPDEIPECKLEVVEFWDSATTQTRVASGELVEVILDPVTPEAKQYLDTLPVVDVFTGEVVKTMAQFEKAQRSADRHWAMEYSFENYLPVLVAEADGEKIAWAVRENGKVKDRNGEYDSEADWVEFLESVFPEVGGGIEIFEEE